MHGSALHVTADPRLVMRAYGDETGASQTVIPLRDDDGPFGVAMVAVMGDVATGALPRGRAKRPEDVVRRLREVRGFPSWSYVQPVPGYGQAWAQKHRILNALGRAQKRATGLNAPYMPDEGLNARNFVWGYAADIALATLGTFAPLCYRLTPTHLEVCFDRKTLQDEHRESVRKVARNFSASVRQGLLGDVATLTPDQARLVTALAEKVNVPPENVTVTWSDEPGFTASQPEMDLADSLAWHCRREVEGKGNISSLLQQAGYRTFRMTNITKVMMEPISSERIRVWENRSGLSAADLLGRD